MYTYSSASLLRNRRIGSSSGDRSAQQKRAREARETQRQFEVSSRQYQCVRIVGKGAYGVVCEAIDKTVKDRSQQRVAIKKIKEALFHPLDAKLVLRELKLSRLLSKHPNVLGIRTVVKPLTRRKMDTIYVVSSFMDTDLYRLCQSRVELTDKHIRHLMFQTLSGLQFLHSANVLHRDMKTANLLVDRHFNLKICDFGLARLVRPGETLPAGSMDQKMQEDLNGPPLTELVVTLWYRAPELVANSNYDAAIDMWAVGCIFAEMLLRRPVFPGKDHLHQLQLITDVMGTPTEEDVRSIRGAYARRVLRSLPYRPAKPMDRVFGGAHPEAIDLIEQMLVFNSGKRVTASEALEHSYFDSVRSNTSKILIEESIEHEFEFDLDKDPQLVSMRQLIYDEIMLYHDSRSRSRHETRSRSQSRSSSKSPNTTAGEQLESTGARGRTRGREQRQRDSNNRRSRSRSHSKTRNSSSSTSKLSSSSSSSSSTISTSSSSSSIASDSAATASKSSRISSITKATKNTYERATTAPSSSVTAALGSTTASTINNSVKHAFQHVASPTKKDSTNSAAPSSSFSDTAKFTASKFKTSTSNSTVKTPPRTDQDQDQLQPRSASPPRPPSANELSRPPSAGSLSSMFAPPQMLPPPPAAVAAALADKLQGLSVNTNTSNETKAMPSPKKRRKPPPRNRTSSGALMLESERMGATAVTTTTMSSGSVKKPAPFVFTKTAVVESTASSVGNKEKNDQDGSPSLPDKLLMSVEIAQKTSSDLLEDLRMRRVKQEVKARVKDASAALDAALATSKPALSSSASASFETIKSSTSSSLTKTAAGTTAAKTSNRLFDRANKKSVAARASAASDAASGTNGGMLARTVSSPADISANMNKLNEFSRQSRATSSSSSSSKLLFNRSDRYDKRPFSSSSSYAATRDARNHHKENVPNADDERKAPVRRTKKRTTVPKPFTFTSRRKAKATPKHIRNQREALARRKAREQGRGTRQTRFF